MTIFMSGPLGSLITTVTSFPSGHFLVCALKTLLRSAELIPVCAVALFVTTGMALEKADWATHSKTTHIRIARSQYQDKSVNKQDSPPRPEASQTRFSSIRQTPSTARKVMYL